MKSINGPKIYLSAFLAFSTLCWVPALAGPLVYKGDTKLSTQKPLPPLPHIVPPPVKRVEKALAPSLPIEPLDSGEKSGIRLFQAVVVQSKADFNLLWSRHQPGNSAPEVDFDKYTVLAIFEGQKNRVGNKVQITAVRKSPGGADVSYKITNTGGGTPNAMIKTQPYQIVKTAKLTGSIAFTKAD